MTWADGAPYRKILGNSLWTFARFAMVLAAVVFALGTCQQSSIPPVNSSVQIDDAWP